MEKITPTGNRVLISHSNQQYSLFMHLKQNSIKLKMGEKVKASQAAGECSNNGNSTAPHFEYRLQKNSSGRPFRRLCRLSSSTTLLTERR